jgi:hypothetical protein
MQESIEQRADRLVRQEVNVCLSYLVSTLAGAYGRWSENDRNGIQPLCEQAFELCTPPVQDWEEAAREAGWKETEDFMWAHSDKPGWDANSAQEVCEAEGIDPYECEIFEHWSISQWLADRLIEQEERVDTDFAGMCVWGRTTTGQGIAQDSVIRRIVEKLYAAEAA